MNMTFSGMLVEEGNGSGASGFYTSTAPKGQLHYHSFRDNKDHAPQAQVKIPATELHMARGFIGGNRPKWGQVRAASSPCQPLGCSKSRATQHTLPATPDRGHDRVYIVTSSSTSCQKLQRTILHPIEHFLQLPTPTSARSAW